MKEFFKSPEFIAIVLSMVALIVAFTVSRPDNSKRIIQMQDNGCAKIITCTERLECPSSRSNGE